MLLSAIVAIDKNYTIGKDNTIPWHLPADLRYFKKTTLHCPIIMGRKCYESIGRPLPKRLNIVITRNPDYVAEGCTVVHSLAEAIQVAKASNPSEIFLIGGGEIYREGLPLCKQVYLTKVDTIVKEAAVFFPRLSAVDWQLQQEEKHEADEKNPHDYAFCRYQRTNSNLHQKTI